jgi:hypothetical protein
MSWLVLDEAGELLAIYNDEVDGAIEAEVPAGYPEQVSWDAATGAFVTSLDKLRTKKRLEINDYLQARFLDGFSPPAGPLQGHVLQVRDVEDRTNWLTSQAAYLAAVSSGLGAEMGADFRTAANETINCSYADGLNTLLMMADWGKALMGKSWALKDALEQLTDPQAIEDYDVAAEWAALP